MKHAMIVLSLMTCLLAAEPPKPPAKPPKGIPANATYDGEGIWKHKDADGKSWIYSQGPLGMSRRADPGDKPDASAPAQPAPSQAKPVKVVAVKGDLVTIEFDTPFGKSGMTKKRGDLDASERAALEKFEKAAQAPQK